jgi:4-amino-4-deoxy-L-arabinose transferase-like glycosyltransferase
VVARNLVAGRGWVVDYVTQFYQLYPGVTRHQETWPLLQPVWIAPFFALLGAESWVAKIPNLIFTVLLALMIYGAGARVWDRRVGLTAALVILTSHLFFKLVIYATSDLAFVVFSFGAIFLLYRATDQPPTTDHRPPTAGGGEGERGRGGEGETSQSPILNSQFSILNSQSSILHPPSSILYPLSSAVLTGLMLLQKPASGGLIALGMGLWFLAWAWRGGRGEGAHPPTAWRGRLFRLLNVGAWGTIALLILVPYLARNIELFGVPFYSTESRDAWVIEYTGVWDEIYKVYIPDFGLGADGPPDRSWVLRWGFDGTLRKLVRQVAAVRDYVAPPWQGLPLGVSAWLTPAREDKDTRLLFGMGAWLVLFGALGVLRARRRLGTLLLAAFVPYLLFLVGYWHANEERYFVMIMPWLALLASYALWGIYDRIALIGDGRWTPVGLALALSALVLVVQPSWPEIAKKVQQEPRLYAADIDAYNWLRANTEPGDVMMTRLPWQLNWHSQRPAVMIPYTSDPNVFLRLARYYKARYLVLDSLQRPKEEVRTMLDALIENSDPRARFELVYATTYQATDGQGRPIALTTEVYRFPESYGDVAELRP